MKEVTLQDGPFSGDVVEVEDSAETYDAPIPMAIGGERVVAYDVTQDGEDWVGNMADGEEADLEIHVPPPCMGSGCSCSDKEGTAVTVSGYPPFHDGCVCLVVRGQN